MNGETENWPSHHLLQKGRNLAVDAVSAEVLASLASAGVEAILLKGKSIELALYENETRLYGDCDILVPENEYLRAVETLQELGFRGPNRMLPGLGIHSTEFRRDLNPIEVDLHITLPFIRQDPMSVWQVVSAYTDKVQLAGVEARVFQPEMLAVHIALHLLQNPEDQVPTEDLARALNKFTSDQWKTAMAIAAELEVNNEILASLSLLPAGQVPLREFGNEFDISGEAWLRHTFPPVQASFAQSILILGRLPWRRKVSFLFTKLFPTRDELLRFNPRMTTRTDFAAAYFWRLLKLLVFLPSGLRAWGTAKFKGKAS